MGEGLFNVQHNSLLFENLIKVEIYLLKETRNFIFGRPDNMVISCEKERLYVLFK